MKSTLIGAGLALAPAAPAPRFLENNSNRFGFEAASTALAPVVLFTAWLSPPRGFRNFASPPFRCAASQLSPGVSI
jgi:hypothetical protein